MLDQREVVRRHRASHRAFLRVFDRALARRAASIERDDGILHLRLPGAAGALAGQRRGLRRRRGARRGAARARGVLRRAMGSRPGRSGSMPGDAAAARGVRGRGPCPRRDAGADVGRAGRAGPRAGRGGDRRDAVVGPRRGAQRRGLRPPCRPPGGHDAAARIPHRCLRAVALLDGRPAASATANVVGDDAHVLLVATLPDARGRGLAAACMRNVLARARERGATSSTLEATQAGRPVYRRMGYRELGALGMWERRRDLPPALRADGRDRGVGVLAAIAPARHDGAMRVAVLALHDAQSLDVLGPGRGLRRRGAVAARAGAYAVEVVTPGRRRRRALQRRCALSARALPAPRAAARTRSRRGRRGRASRAAPTTRPSRWLRARRAARAARGLGLHRRVRARAPPGCSTAAARRRTGPGATALARRAPGVDGRARPDLRARRRRLDLGRRDRRDGPRARARRGGPRPRRRARGRPLARAVPQAPRRPVAVQRRAGRAGGGRASRCASSRRWIADHLDADLSVAARSPRARSLSERHFARAFRAETGVTPAAYVEGLRVERARALLEDGAAPSTPSRAPSASRSAETLRRAFHRRLGVGPAAYRERFRSAA